MEWTMVITIENSCNTVHVYKTLVLERLDTKFQSCTKCRTWELNYLSQCQYILCNLPDLQAKPKSYLLQNVYQNILDTIYNHLQWKPIH